MRFTLFFEVQLTEDFPEYHLSRGSRAIIVDYCPRPEGQEDGYVLEVLDNQGKGFTVITVEASEIESIQNDRKTGTLNYEKIPLRND
ncbi:DUF4926 domain-containing protein [Pannus brasiliensis]|uniref:DUF4926 domain-containing protein n=1 Tax=Pannus brasiliensis TaxID=1579216 RepID=UPI003BEEC137